MTDAPTLHYTVGLPASGKTTWARELVRLKPRTVRANRDDIRQQLHEGRFSGGNEKIVTKVQDAVIRAGIADGRDVVVDDTNLNPKTRARLAHLAEECGASLVSNCDFVDVPLRDCIERDLRRERPVGEHVIRRMWEQYLMPPLRKRTGKPTCVIVDVDGTLALNTGRSPYDWARVSEDRPNTMVAEMVRRFIFAGGEPTVVVVSGRDGSCAEATEAWLAEHLHGWGWYGPLMRSAGDNRPDWLVKAEILNNDILPLWDPVLAIDDRQQVVDMWRSEGIECWQVAPGRF